MAIFLDDETPFTEEEYNALVNSYSKAIVPSNASQKQVVINIPKPKKSPKSASQEPNEEDDEEIEEFVDQNAVVPEVAREKMIIMPSGLTDIAQLVPLQLAVVQNFGLLHRCFIITLFASFVSDTAIFTLHPSTHDDGMAARRDLLLTIVPTTKEEHLEVAKQIAAISNYLENNGKRSPFDVARKYQDLFGKDKLVKV